MSEREGKRARPRSRGPWYTAGLPFSCRPECGACCTRHQDYAYVYLKEEDIRRLSRFLGLSRREFLNRYAIVDDGDLVMKMEEPACPFLDGWRCRVYEARPVQCRTFPFWSESLTSRATWNRLKRFCPGINEGEIHSLKVIREHLRARDED